MNYLINSMELTDKIIEAIIKVMAIVVMFICIGLLTKIRNNEKEEIISIANLLKLNKLNLVLSKFL